MKNFILLMALVAAGCGNNQDGGVECKINSDCDVGLSCLAVMAANTTGVCAATGKLVCTKQCATSDECIKSVPVCVTSCAGLKTCANPTK